MAERGAALYRTYGAQPGQVSANAFELTFKLNDGSGKSTPIAAE
jgi:hypothetical protein